MLAEEKRGGGDCTSSLKNNKKRTEGGKRGPNRTKGRTQGDQGWDYPFFHTKREKGILPLCEGGDGGEGIA